MSYSDPSARVQELIDLMQLLNPDRKITSQDKMQGTTLQVLGETGAGGYQRCLKWLRDKVVALPPKIADNDYAADPDNMKELYKQSWELMKSRNAKYGDSWRVLTIPAIAALIEMKMHRIANMDVQNLDPKAVDEFIDTMNYAAMGLQKLKEQGKTI